ncbi:MAG: hypothetical protein C0408_00325 [Odoribacter sp.]|nr:hypothetical protein [Odoribacter sp.]
MKKRDLILLAVFLVSIIFTVQTLSAQEKTIAEKEKEQKLQQAIELQKKAMSEQKKSQELQSNELERIMQEAEQSVTKSSDAMNFYRSRMRSTGEGLERLDEPFIVSPGMAYSGYFSRSGDSERTTWDFSKQVKESTFSRDYSFDVEASANTVVMTVLGDCKMGKIRVKITMPGGKVYSDIVIDEFGNLNWRKSFTDLLDVNKDKAGEWKFRIEAEKATGFFKITLQTY